MTASNVSRFGRGQGFTFEVDALGEWLTLGAWTRDESWRGTCPEGHPLQWDDESMVEVVEHRHWCDGTEGIMRHDPHEVVDAAHWECATCRARVEPRLHPPGTTMFVRGPVTGRLTGPTGRPGERRTILLDEHQVNDLAHALATNEAHAETVAVALLAAPDARVVDQTITFPH